MTKYIDADIFVTHCCNSCIKNGVSCCPTVDSCDYIEDLQAFLVDATAAADRLEQQEQRIAELEAENRDILQNSQCAKLLVRNGELERELEWKDKVIELAQRKQDEAERELAAAKEDLHHNDACSVCIGADQEVCKDCDLECQTCVLDCRCKDCRDESKWEWRGAREGEG